MKTSFTATGEQLASALRALNVNFITGGTSGQQTFPIEPAQLLAALAQSRESRLRLSLIPLFLEHPEFSVHTKVVARTLDPTARLLFQCYYTAAVCLQQQYRARVEGLIGKKPSLPDYFSHELVLEISARTGAATDLFILPSDSVFVCTRVVAAYHRPTGSYVRGSPFLC